LYGAFVWARRALNHQKRRFPARAVITALGAFRPGAKWIGAGVSNATFSLARRVVQAPAAAKVRRIDRLHHRAEQRPDHAVRATPGAVKRH
jgi:hypothetical protein